MKSILITGASGFVGSRLLHVWEEKEKLQPVSVRSIEDIEGINWQNVETVIHLGGLAHQIPPASRADYFDANHVLTGALGHAAKKNGVKHLIFLSTIKVYGDTVDFVDHETKSSPDDDYGESKLSGEKDLLKLSAEDFCVSVIRPPLIVGPGAKGNLEKLMALAIKKYPLPFAGIQNRRSMIGLDELIDIIRKLADRPQTGTLILSSSPVSTTRLIAEIRQAMGFSSPRLFRLPGLEGLLKRVKPDLHSRLFRSYVIDDQSSRKELGLGERSSISPALKAMVEDYLTKQ